MEIRKIRPNDFRSQSQPTTARLSQLNRCTHSTVTGNLGVRELLRSPTKKFHQISLHTPNVTPKSHSTTSGTSEIIFNSVGILVTLSGGCNLYQLHLSSGHGGQEDEEPRREGREDYHHLQNSIIGFSSSYSSSSLQLNPCSLFFFFCCIIIALSFQFAAGLTDN